MTISEETLMAFADGELDPAGCEAVEQAMREDPSIGQRLARHRALRQRLRLAYSAPLDEPIPERLLAAARQKSRNVVQMSEARAALARDPEAPRASALARPAQSLGWRPLGSLAASVLVGIALGYGLFREGGASLLRAGDGSWMASGALARTLSDQLAADQPDGAVARVGVSYLNRSGEYCRSFALTGSAPSAGIACRGGAAWRIEALGRAAPAETGGYRTAATALSPALLQLIREQIQGDALDAAGEARALRGGWRRTP